MAKKNDMSIGKVATNEQMGSLGYETKDGPEVRIQRIKELAAKYEKLTPKEKSTLIEFIKGDLKTDMDKLVAQVQELERLLGEPSTPKTTAPKPRNNGSMSISKAILQVLEGGKEMDRNTILEKSKELTGGIIKDATFTATLSTLKSDKKILKLEGGKFKLAA